MSSSIMHIVNSEYEALGFFNQTNKMLMCLHSIIILSLNLIYGQDLIAAIIQSILFYTFIYLDMIIAFKMKNKSFEDIIMVLRIICLMIEPFTIFWTFKSIYHAYTTCYGVIKYFLYFNYYINQPRIINQTKNGIAFSS